MENSFVSREINDLTNEMPVIFVPDPESEMKPEALAKAFLLNFLEVNSGLMK